MKKIREKGNVGLLMQKGNVKSKVSDRLQVCPPLYAQVCQHTDQVAAQLRGKKKAKAGEKEKKRLKNQRENLELVKKCQCVFVSP